MTELEAINIMLAGIGEQPVSSLDSGVAEAILARQALATANRTVQLLHWHFNSDFHFDLLPDTNGEITLPRNCIRIRCVGGWPKVTQRGSRLYDLTNNTFKFSGTASVDISWLLPFEEIPPAAQEYVVAKAGRRFQQGVAGSQVGDFFSETAESEAKRILEESDGDVAMRNILHDHEPAASTVRRDRCL